jgi:hypothetical protein
MAVDPFQITPTRARSTNHLNLRLRDSGYEWVEQQMDQHNIDKSEVVKAALAFAAKNPAAFSKLIEARKAQA